MEENAKPEDEKLAPKNIENRKHQKNRNSTGREEIQETQKQYIKNSINY